MSNLCDCFNLQQLLSIFRTIKSMRVHRAALWILGEYTQSTRDITAVVDLLKQSLGSVSNVSAQYLKIIKAIYNFCIL